MYYPRFVCETLRNLIIKRKQSRTFRTAASSAGLLAAASGDGFPHSPLVPRPHLFLEHAGCLELPRSGVGKRGAVGTSAWGGCAGPQPSAQAAGRGWVLTAETIVLLSGRARLVPSTVEAAEVWASCGPLPSGRTRQAGSATEPCHRLGAQTSVCSASGSPCAPSWKREATVPAHGSWHTTAGVLVDVPFAV